MVAGHPLKPREEEVTTFITSPLSVISRTKMGRVGEGQYLQTGNKGKKGLTPEGTGLDGKSFSL